MLNVFEWAGKLVPTGKVGRRKKRGRALEIDHPDAPHTHPEGIINELVLHDEYGLGTVTFYRSDLKKWVCTFLDLLTKKAKKRVAYTEAAVIHAMKEATAARQRAARSDVDLDIEGL